MSCHDHEYVSDHGPSGADLRRTAICTAYFSTLACQHESNHICGVYSMLNGQDTFMNLFLEFHDGSGERHLVFRWAAYKKTGHDGPGFSIQFNWSWDRSDQSSASSSSASTRSRSALPRASSSRSTNSMTAIGALSPWRKPAFMMRMYPPLRSS